MYVGLDIGGTKTAVFVVDEVLQIRARYVAKTEVTNPNKLVDGVVASINRALELAGISYKQILAIGAGLPGRVNPETGEVASAVNLNLESYLFGQILSSIYRVPVVLENDVRAAALGAFQWLCQQNDINHMAYLSIGTGISAGLVLNGKLHRGVSGMAGEIGHTMFEPGGIKCRCGAHGCLESISSGPAMTRQWQESTRSIGMGSITAKDLFAAADRGDETALAVIKRSSHFVARAIQMLIMLYDVEKVVLGGGVMKAGASFYDPILSALAQIRNESSLANEMLQKNKFVLLPPGSDVPTWGAVNLALQAIK